MTKTQERINNICLMILAAATITGILIYTKSILIPFVFSLFFFSVIQPIVESLQTKLRCPRALAILITSVALATITALTLVFISNSLEGFVKSAGIYKERILQMTSWVSTLLTKWGVPIDDLVLRQELKKMPVLSLAKNVTGGVFQWIGNLSLILIFVAFLLIGHSPNNKKPKLWLEVQGKISRYTLSKLMLSLATAIITWLILFLFKIELAFMFAILALGLNFIPNIGSLIAILLPLPIAFLQLGFGLPFFAVLILTALTQFTIGNVLEPKLMGEAMDLHPITILLFLMFWGLVWGVPGMFLAVPITAVVKIVLSRLEPTQGLSELLAGRWSQS